MTEEQRLNDFINKIEITKEGDLSLGLITLKRWIQQYGKRMYEAGIKKGREENGSN